MRVLVSQANGGLSVKPLRKNGKPHTAGTVMITNAFFASEHSVIGELQHEAMEHLEPTLPALTRRLVPVFILDGRVFTKGAGIDITDCTFSVAYLYGDSVLVSKEW